MTSEQSVTDLLTSNWKSWNHFDKECCFRIMKSMPERIKAVIKALEEETKHLFICQRIPQFFPQYKMILQYLHLHCLGKNIHHEFT